VSRACAATAISASPLSSNSGFRRAFSKVSRAAIDVAPAVTAQRPQLRLRRRSKSVGVVSFFRLSSVVRRNSNYLRLEALIWPRISPPGERLVWTFAYATPARIAAMTSSSSPDAICWPAGPMTCAAVIVPVTTPDPGGQVGVPAGPGIAEVPHRNAMTPPFTPN
jgi:hypothetical protein